MYTRSSNPRPSIACRLSTAALVLVLSMPHLAMADSSHQFMADDEHVEEHPLTPQERATRLRERGEILPLAEVIRINGLDRIGRIIEVDLEEDHGQQVYELKILTNDSVVREYLIDPRTGRILGVE